MCLASPGGSKAGVQSDVKTSLLDGKNYVNGNEDKYLTLSSTANIVKSVTIPAGISPTSQGSFRSYPSTQ